MLKNDVAGAMPKQNLFVRFITLSWLKKSTIVEIIALFFVILFLYTGISKLMDFLVFREQLAESPVLEPIAPLVAWGLPVTEFIVSILLFFPRYRLKGLYAAFALMVLFTGYVIAVLLFSTELPCSCGGIIELLSWKGHLIFNTLLILLAYTGIRMAKKLRQRTY
jgi:uncharacterized membrane protein YphA (DoxX/SURF4 family)